MSLRVLKPGLLTTLQDAGRVGHAALGVSISGAADTVALRLANALAGNAPDAVALEFTLIGPRLQFDVGARVALIGDAAATLDGKPFTPWRAAWIDAGGTLECAALRRGLRGYLAVQGLQAERVLGSSSSDTNAGIGPFGGRALQAGDILSARAAATFRSDATWSLDPRPWCDEHPMAPIRLIAGSHFDELDVASRSALLDAEFRIASESNRVGWRLDGPRLALTSPQELISTGVVPGTLQLPPGGQPIVLGVEGPTSGGYPRIGHVIGVDLARLAQRRPGDAVRFELTDRAEARRLWRQREGALQSLEAAIRARISA